MLLVPDTRVFPLASTMFTWLPLASTTCPPSATLRFVTVESPVTVQVEVPSTLTVMLSSALEVAESLAVIDAAPVHEEFWSRYISAVDMESAATLPFSVWLIPVKLTVAPLLQAVPQLLESLPSTCSKLAFVESKSSVVFDRTMLAVVLVE